MKNLEYKAEILETEWEDAILKLKNMKDQNVNVEKDKHNAIVSLTTLQYKFQAVQRD